MWNDGKIVTGYQTNMQSPVRRTQQSLTRGGSAHSKGSCTLFVYLPFKNGTPRLERGITKPGNFLDFCTTMNSSINLFKVFFAYEKTDFPTLKLYT